MKDYENDLLALLSVELSETVNLYSNNLYFNEILKCAVRHAVVPLLFYPVKKLAIDIAEMNLNNLRSEAILSVVNGEKIMSVQKALVDLLTTYHIPCAILKGCSVATYYPHPELRQLGDIDILIPEERLEATRKLLPAYGYEYSSEHEFHVSYEYQGVHIEIHNQITSFPENDAGKYARKLFSHALDNIDTAGYNGFSFPVLSPVYQLLSQLFHMARHMLSSGIGLRQFCDWYVTVDHYCGDIYESIIAAMKNCGLYHFAAVLTQCCVIYMNMKPVEWCKEADIKLCKDMMAEILESGNINRISGERAISTAFIEKSGAANPVSFVGSYIGSMNAKAMERYPITKKFSILLPIFWIVIPFTYLFMMFAGKRKQVNIADTIFTSKKRLKLYNRIGLFR